MSRLKIYVAGPMKNMPERNFPLFNQVTADLRAKDFVVVNPVEIGHAAYGNSEDIDPVEYVKKDLIAMIEHCNAITLLPGWEKSVGAKAEAAVARTLGFIFISNDGENVLTRPEITVTGGYE